MEVVTIIEGIKLGVEGIKLSIELVDTLEKKGFFDNNPFKNKKVTNSKISQKGTVKKSTPSEEIIQLIDRIVGMPSNKIEEMISILEDSSISITKTDLVKRYFDWNERKLLRKIGDNKELKELLEFILDAKIKKECCKELQQI